MIFFFFHNNNFYSATAFKKKQSNYEGIRPSQPPRSNNNFFLFLLQKNWTVQTMAYSSASSISKPFSIATTNPMASSSSTVNRTRTGHRWFPVSCNKCQKAMDSTVFVCSCKCLFCEGKEIQSRWHNPTLEITSRISFRFVIDQPPLPFHFERYLTSEWLLTIVCSYPFFFASYRLLPFLIFFIYCWRLTRLHIQSFPIEFELPGLWTSPGRE